jgi:hypothetical protein
MGGVVTEEKVISHAQYLDLIYSQMSTLYDLLPDAPLPSTTATSTTPTTSHVVDGVIGTFHADTKSTSATHTNPKSPASNVQSALTPTPSTDKTSEVNSVQSTPAGKNKSKKGKGKNKEDRNNNPQSDKPKTQSVDDKDKHKPRYPCLICGDDHYTKDCPRHAEVTKFLQGTKNLPHLPFCHNLSLLNNRLNWSFMTNPLLPPLHMSLCVLVILPRMTLPSPLEPKIILLQRRKLTIYHLHWFNHLLQLHLPMVLFISNDRVPIQFSPSSKGRCSEVCLQSSCTCCSKLQYCRRSCASTLYDVSSRSPSKLSHSTEGTVKGHQWN